MPVISRRHFMTLALGGLLVPRLHAHAAPQVHRVSYHADVGILYDMLSLHLDGTIEESIDRSLGRYRVIADGTGRGIANHFEAAGTLRGKRWAPVRSVSWFDVRGRQSRTEIAYDWTARTIEYQARGETFFLRRVRVVDDVIKLEGETHVDDVISATLNFMERRWPHDPTGRYTTVVVRRKRTDEEGPDDIAPSYRAELVAFELKVVSDHGGKVNAFFDLSRFSSWASPARPARIVFGETRRPEVVTSSMMLGTSVTIRFSTS